MQHPASSSMGMKKKKLHELVYHQLSVKIDDNFTENLSCWCRYFMLSIVLPDNGIAEFQELSPAKVKVLVALLLLLPILASTPADSSSFVKEF